MVNNTHAYLVLQAIQMAFLKGAQLLPHARDPNIFLKATSLFQTSIICCCRGGGEMHIHLLHPFFCYKGCCVNSNIANVAGYWVVWIAHYSLTDKLPWSEPCILFQLSKIFVGRVPSIIPCQPRSICVRARTKCSLIVWEFTHFRFVLWLFFHLKVHSDF